MENQLGSTKDKVAMAGSKCLPLLQPSKPVRTAKKSRRLEMEGISVCFRQTAGRFGERQYCIYNVRKN